MQNNSPKLTGAALMGSQNSERREVPRYPFVASAEQIDVIPEPSSRRAFQN
jgi:hypothetical protein